MHRPTRALPMGSRNTMTSDASFASSSMAASTSKGYRTLPSTRPGVSMSSSERKAFFSEVENSVTMWSQRPGRRPRRSSAGKLPSVIFPRHCVRFLPRRTSVTPAVSMATLVVCTFSPTYQLINDDLPAEWLPRSRTEMQSLGARIARTRSQRSCGSSWKCTCSCSSSALCPTRSNSLPMPSALPQSYTLAASRSTFSFESIPLCGEVTRRVHR
mmetsp:Transcript_42297/g.62184  ORF Transcript_42297/g.62184 Transcript_42297/m.62184 type:complete len:214 (-) Transcript_42297:118-759(-)